MFDFKAFLYANFFEFFQKWKSSYFHHYLVKNEKRMSKLSWMSACLFFIVLLIISNLETTTFITKFRLQV